MMGPPPGMNGNGMAGLPMVDLEEVPNG